MDGVHIRINHQGINMWEPGRITVRLDMDVKKAKMGLMKEGSSMTGNKDLEYIMQVILLMKLCTKMIRKMGQESKRIRKAINSMSISWMESKLRKIKKEKEVQMWQKYKNWNKDMLYKFDNFLHNNFMKKPSIQIGKESRISSE